jgi:hypothetical protein
MKTGIKFFSILLILAILLIASGCTQPASTTVPATPPPVATKENMESFVESAVEYAHTHSKEDALAEFSDKNGSFSQGTLYIYAYDFNGTTIAHPVNPEKIGVNRLDEPDALGNHFIRELRDVALNGSGFVEYYYINPVHNNTVERKLGYVEKVDDTWWLGSGIYFSPVESTATNPGSVPPMSSGIGTSVNGAVTSSLHKDMEREQALAPPL